MNDLKKIRHQKKLINCDNISPKKPFWLKVKLLKVDFDKQKVYSDLNITTVCEEASCPNICWSKQQL